MLDESTVGRLAEFCDLIRRCRTAYDALDRDLTLPEVLRDETVRHIGVHHNVLGIGGIGRVLPIMIERMRTAGFKVTVFIDRELPPGSGLGTLPADVDVVVLPKAVADSSAKRLVRRIEVLAREIRERRIDAWYDHSHNLVSWSDNPALWTMMAVRYVLALPCFMHVHAQFTMDLYRGDGDRFDVLLRKFFPRWLSSLVVLSRADEWFFRSRGAEAVYMPNPLDRILREVANGPRPVRPWGKTVLWVGRMASVQKQPVEALKVFARVHKRDPATRMIMLGDGDAMADALSFRKKHRLDDCVELTGVRKDAYEFYRRADVFLCTSRFEGFSLVLLEAMAHAVPIVSYEMPYLETLHGNDGAVCVPQGDVTSAADAVLRLLGDRDLAARTGAAALAHLRKLDAFDFASAYSRIFQGRVEPSFTGVESVGLRQVAEDCLWGSAAAGNYVFRNTLLAYGRLFRPVTRALLAYHVFRSVLAAPFSKRASREHKEKAARLEKLYRWVSKPGRRVPLFG